MMTYPLAITGPEVHQCTAKLQKAVSVLPSPPSWGPGTTLSIPPGCPCLSLWPQMSHPPKSLQTEKVSMGIAKAGVSRPAQHCCCPNPGPFNQVDISNRQHLNFSFISVSSSGDQTSLCGDDCLKKQHEPFSSVPPLGHCCISKATPSHQAQPTFSSSRKPSVTAETLSENALWTGDCARNRAWTQCTIHGCFVKELI